MKKTYLPETFLVGENNFDIYVCHIWWHLLEIVQIMKRKGEKVEEGMVSWSPFCPLIL
jgi:hypothetical protein